MLYQMFLSDIFPMGYGCWLCERACSAKRDPFGYSLNFQLRIGTGPDEVFGLDPFRSARPVRTHWNGRFVHVIYLPFHVIGLVLLTFVVLIVCGSTTLIARGDQHQHDLISVSVLCYSPIDLISRPEMGFMWSFTNFN